MAPRKRPGMEVGPKTRSFSPVEPPSLDNMADSYNLAEYWGPPPSDGGGGRPPPYGGGQPPSSGPEPSGGPIIRGIFF